MLFLFIFVWWTNPLLFYFVNIFVFQLKKLPNTHRVLFLCVTLLFIIVFPFFLSLFLCVNARVCICHLRVFKTRHLSSPCKQYTNKQGLKRSVTTLRGGSLGYAEIVAVKVFIFFSLVRAFNSARDRPTKIDCVAIEPQLPGSSLVLCVPQIPCSRSRSRSHFNFFYSKNIFVFDV